MVRGSRVLFLNRVSDARAVAFHARRTLPALWHVSPVSLFPIEEKGVGVRLFKRNYGSLILIYTYRSYTILQHSCAHKLWRENLNSFYVWIDRQKVMSKVHAHPPTMSHTWAQCIQRLRGEEKGVVVEFLSKKASQCSIGPQKRKKIVQAYATCQTSFGSPVNILVIIYKSHAGQNPTFTT